MPAAAARFPREVPVLCGVSAVLVYVFISRFCFTTASYHALLVQEVLLADRIAQAHGMHCWLDMGSLLGAYRMQHAKNSKTANATGGPLPWDHDGDYSCMDTERAKWLRWENARRAKRMGLLLVQHQNGLDLRIVCAASFPAEERERIDRHWASPQFEVSEGSASAEEPAYVPLVNGVDLTRNIKPYVDVLFFQPQVPQAAGSSLVNATLVRARFRGWSIKHLPGRYVDPLSCTSFGDECVLAPNDIPAVLATRYGRDWKTPNRTFGEPNFSVAQAEICSHYDTRPVITYFVVTAAVVLLLVVVRVMQRRIVRHDRCRGWAWSWRRWWRPRETPR